MPKIKYKDFNFRQATLDMIAKANEIIAEYSAQGFGQQYTRHTKRRYVKWFCDRAALCLFYFIVCSTISPTATCHVIHTPIASIEVPIRIHVLYPQADGGARNYSCQQSEEDGNAVTLYFDGKWREYVYRMGMITAICSAFIGFWLIYSSFIVENKVPTELKMTLGVFLIFTGWLMIHASLDVLYFGRVYWGHLL